MNLPRRSYTSVYFNPYIRIQFLIYPYNNSTIGRLKCRDTATDGENELCEAKYIYCYSLERSIYTATVNHSILYGTMYDPVSGVQGRYAANGKHQLLTLNGEKSILRTGKSIANLEQQLQGESLECSKYPFYPHLSDNNLVSTGFYTFSTTILQTQ